MASVHFTLIQSHKLCVAFLPSDNLCMVHTAHFVAFKPTALCAASNDAEAAEEISVLGTSTIKTWIL